MQITDTCYLSFFGSPEFCSTPVMSSRTSSYASSCNRLEHPHILPLLCPYPNTTRYSSLFNPHSEIFQSGSFSLPFSKELTGETEISANGTKPFQPGNGICSLPAQISM